jgi:hypothetical protein
MKELENLKKLRIIPGFLVFLALVYFCYSIDSSISESRKIVYGERTVEQIINTPQPYIPSEPWDKDFKSAITPAEESK